MKSVSIASGEKLENRRYPSRFEQLARRAVLARLAMIEVGEIVLDENGTSQSFGAAADASGLSTVLSVRDTQFYSEVAFGGSIGAAESYVHGDWSCSDLTSLVRILLRNRAVLGQMDSGLATVARALQKLWHRRNRNTRNGSRRNIAAHYDLGNDFYALWLDRTMMYSGAWFEHANCTLEQASVAKLDRICRKLNLQPSDRVLEIGSGWGGFAIHAAQNYGCHVTTVTISEQQYQYAREAITAAGLEDRVQIEIRDYRDIDGQFDKLVSIEMIEAVGDEFQATFFRKCCDSLKPDGQMLLQSITIADQQYDRYRSGVDFIRRYVFPGGCLTSVTSMAEILTKATDMRILHLEDIGLHYAKTLRHWRQRFLENLDGMRKLGYEEEFLRLWNYYLCYCEGAFRERAIGNVQMHIVKPLARPAGP